MLIWKPFIKFCAEKFCQEYVFILRIFLDYAGKATNLVQVFNNENWSSRSIILLILLIILSDIDFNDLNTSMKGIRYMFKVLKDTDS